MKMIGLWHWLTFYYDTVSEFLKQSSFGHSDSAEWSLFNKHKNFNFYANFTTTINNLRIKIIGMNLVIVVPSCFIDIGSYTNQMFF